MISNFLKKLVFCFFLIGIHSLNHSAMAQQFKTSIEVPAFSGICTVIKQDGSICSGNLRGLRLGRGGIKKIVLRDTTSGVKTYLYAKDIATVRFRNSKFNKVLNVINSFESIKKAANTDFEDLTQNSVVFERMSPYKKKYYVGQLLNPDFSSTIKVFYSPTARKTSGFGILTGGMNRAYIVEKGGEAFKIKRGNYNRNSRKLFGDSPEFMRVFSGRKKFKDIEEHIFQYEKLKRQSHVSGIDQVISTALSGFPTQQASRDEE